MNLGRTVGNGCSMELLFNGSSPAICIQFNRAVLLPFLRAPFVFNAESTPMFHVGESMDFDHTTPCCQSFIPVTHN